MPSSSCRCVLLAVMSGAVFILSFCSPFPFSRVYLLKWMGLRLPSAMDGSSTLPSYSQNHFWAWTDERSSAEAGKRVCWLHPTHCRFVSYYSPSRLSVRQRNANFSSSRTKSEIAHGKCVYHNVLYSLKHISLHLPHEQPSEFHSATFSASHGSCLNVARLHI